eukprot:4237547-Pleurochrysis_carterae.AAC.2
MRQKAAWLLNRRVLLADASLIVHGFISSSKKPCAGPDRGSTAEYPRRQGNTFSHTLASIPASVMDTQMTRGDHTGNGDPGNLTK